MLIADREDLEAATAAAHTKVCVLNMYTYIQTHTHTHKNVRLFVWFI